MTPQEIKNSILWTAVQGKLSTQHHNESVAFTSDTWDINEEENFTIPENWKWKRFSFFGDLRMGKTILKSDLSDKGIPVYSATQSDDVLGYIERAELDLHRNDLVIPARGNSIGYVTLVQDEIATCTQTTICVRNIHDICPEYLYWCCYAFKDKWFVFSGSAIPQVTVKQISRFMVPTPPIEEQKRIVAKLEEILPLIDRYEAAWNKLEEFNKRFPGDMQKSILQLANQGKLVEQRPEEGTGEELFQQIQAEKEALIKAGKIKKEKPLPEIAEDEIPFDIPDSWKWVRLNNLVSVLGDGIHGTPIFDEAGTHYFVNGNNLVKGNIVFKADTKKVSTSEYEKYKKPLDENTILISINGTIGNYAFYANEPIILGKSACYFSVLTGVNKEYIRHLINTKWFMDYAVKEATQTTIKNVSLKAMRMLPVPLPPLAEQKRIVAKLEEILPLCERLK